MNFMKHLRETVTLAGLSRYQIQEPERERMSLSARHVTDSRAGGVKG